VAVSVQWLFVSVMLLKKKTRRSGGKKKKQGTSRASHAPFLVQFLVCLATKIVAFFIKIADFAFMGPAGLLAAVAQLFTATSMV
jgi:hypothetical protein